MSICDCSWVEDVGVVVSEIVLPVLLRPPRVVSTITFHFLSLGLGMVVLHGILPDISSDNKNDLVTVWMKTNE